MSIFVLIGIGVSLGMVLLSYLLGRYAIRVILYALWVSIALFGAFLVYQGLQAMGEFAGYGETILVLFIVAPAFVVSVGAGIVGLIGRDRANAG